MTLYKYRQFKCFVSRNLQEVEKEVNGFLKELGDKYDSMLVQQVESAFWFTVWYWVHADVDINVPEFVVDGFKRFVEYTPLPYPPEAGIKDGYDPETMEKIRKVFLPKEEQKKEKTSLDFRTALDKKIRAAIDEYSEKYVQEPTVLIVEENLKRLFKEMIAYFYHDENHFIEAFGIHFYFTREPVEVKVF